jgi:speckle-type POZ protein
MKSKIFLFVVFTLLIGCSDYELFEGIKIRQYATKVIRFSSQYTTTNWSASQALKPENVYPAYNDNSKAWASLNEDDPREFLELGFDTIQTVRTVEIFETYNPGAIDTVFLRDSSSKKWIKIYSKPAATLEKKSRIFTIQMIETSFFADAIRIAINSKAVSGWNEIDAVAITGQRKNTTNP